jgi:hypothetical protein
VHFRALPWFMRKRPATCFLTDLAQVCYDQAHHLLIYIRLSGSSSQKLAVEDYLGFVHLARLHLMLRHL